MQHSNGNVFVHLAHPTVGNDLTGLIRELAALDGVRRVVPASKFSRLLRVDYDRSVIGARTLLARVQRRWSSAHLVGI